MQDMRSVDFDLTQVAEMGNGILAKIKAVREADPIYWSETNQVWMVTGHKELSEGYAGTLPLANFRAPGPALALLTPQERIERAPRFNETAKRWLFNMDPPEHPRLRKLMSKAFGRPVVEQVRSHARRFIREALDGLRDGEAVEFVAAVTRKIPARTILLLLGQDDAIYPRLHRWSLVLNTTGNVNLTHAQVDEIEQVFSELDELFLPEIEKRQKHPGDDFLSALITAEIDGERLSTQHLLATCNLVLIAGHDTTANTMALGTVALAQHAGARDYFRQKPENIVDAVMEISRYVAMSTVKSRRVTEDFVWNGHQLRAGQYVLMFMAGGNHDPNVFPVPEEIDFSRPQDRNMSFAPGAHHCIGHLLAKMQLSEFFPALVQRFDIELPDDRLDFSGALGFRGLETLNVRMKARA